MSDPDRIAAVAARTDAIIAAQRAEVERVIQDALGICDCGNDHTPWEPRPMKVKDLHALLTEHIAHGRGDDDLYLYPGNIENSEPFMAAWGQQYNYPITDISWTDDDDHFVTLTFDRDREES